MIKVFTDQNLAVVGSVRSYLQEHGVFSQLRNEHSSSLMGEVAFFLVWPELWVSDHDAAQAIELVKDLKNSNADGPEWLCPECAEANPGTFETCWQCGKPHSLKASLEKSAKRT